MCKLLFLILLAATAAPAALAQGTAATDERRHEFFVGYSNLQAEGIPTQERNTTNSFEDRVFGDRNGLNGVNLSYTGYLTPRFGVTGDFSFHTRDRDFTTAGGGRGDLDTRVVNLLGGPQVRFPNQTRATPFLRALFGIANTRFEASESRTGAGGGTITNTFETNATDFAMALGGGLDFRLGERVGLRAIQVDYNPVFLRDRSISVLNQAGAIQAQTLESNRQDNIRLSVGLTFK